MSTKKLVLYVFDISYVLVSGYDNRKRNLFLTIPVLKFVFDLNTLRVLGHLKKRGAYIEWNVSLFENAFQKTAVDLVVHIRCIRKLTGKIDWIEFDLVVLLLSYKTRQQPITRGTATLIHFLNLEFFSLCRLLLGNITFFFFFFFTHFSTHRSTSDRARNSVPSIFVRALKVDPAAGVPVPLSAVCSFFISLCRTIQDINSWVLKSQRPTFSSKLIKFLNTKPTLRVPSKKQTKKLSVIKLNTRSGFGVVGGLSQVRALLI